MQVQIFGTRKCRNTRAAQRFFSEHRVPVHFVDLTKKPASPRELERFARAYGVPALVDPQARRFRDLGLSAASFSDARWLELLAEEPLLLATPLVRCGTGVAVGNAPETWKSWFD